MTLPQLIIASRAAERIFAESRRAETTKAIFNHASQILRHREPSLSDEDIIGLFDSMVKNVRQFVVMHRSEIEAIAVALRGNEVVNSDTILTVIAPYSDPYAGAPTFISRAGVIVLN